MTDIFSPEKRSEIMSKIKGKNTKPELILRKILWGAGYRYRIHYKKLPGNPDIVFPGKRKVIFVHGCFWHVHECHEFTWPKTNVEFWDIKLHRNKERDSKNVEKLSHLGWEVLVVWECEVKTSNLDDLFSKLELFLAQ